MSDDFLSQITELTLQVDRLRAAIERSGLDITCCRICGEPVVSIPDGLPMCEACAEREAAEQ